MSLYKFICLNYKNFPRREKENMIVNVRMEMANFMPN